MKAERLTREHLAGAALLEQACFAEPWSEKALELLTGNDATGAVCVENGTVVAYGGMMFAPGEGQITNIAVSPEFRRQGAGREILSFLLKKAWEHGAESVFLEVRISNTAARALYRSAGFEEIGERKRFYRFPTEDAIVMVKKRESGRGSENPCIF